MALSKRLRHLQFILSPLSAWSGSVPPVQLLMSRLTYFRFSEKASDEESELFLVLELSGPLAATIPFPSSCKFGSVRLSMCGFGAIFKGFVLIPSSTAPERLPAEMDSSSSKNQQNSGADKEVEYVDCETIDRRGKRKEAETPCGESSRANKVPKVVVSRSGVWKHYTGTKESRDKCICHYCQKLFSCQTKSGTSNLMKHLQICREYQAHVISQGKNQTRIDDEGNVKSSKVSETVFREASNELLVLAELPLSFIISTGWKHFCNKVNLYKPHSRRTATRDIVEMFVKKKEALKRWLYTNQQRVSLTTDIWVSQVTCAIYMVVTAHFVNPTWQLKKIILGFKLVMDHKGQTISTFLLECLADWGIQKLFSITVDNATANTSAIRRFHRDFSQVSPDALVLEGNFLHMRCCAHIINLIAKEGLGDLGDNVLAIRNAVQYVRSSSNRLNSFEQRVTTGKMTRGSLPMDVKTRWNSTFLMLSRALQFRDAFDRMEAEDMLYNDYFLEVENGVKRQGPPDVVDWNAVDKLKRFLIIFYNSTLVVSASSKVNSYKCYGEIVTIERNLTALANNLDLDLKLKAEDMLHKFLKYWDGMKNVNRMLIIASIIDPRKKMNFANLWFEKLYGKASFKSKEMTASVLDLLTSMFQEYSSRFKGASTQSSQTKQTPSTSVQETQEQMERLKLVVEDFGYERMDYVYKELVSETENEARDELEMYLKEPVENQKLMMGFEFDILGWWKVHRIKFPVLAEMARDLLAIEQWMKADIKFAERVQTNEQILAEVEMLDKLEKEFGNVRLED
ncbi:PREDICTED: zinc finger BED domain-containing protein RICESLEEPER 2-like [Brassica oleracea var. oleracea]|uniref:zinc finger BED domain-containing protein RICESLEEPER 2-like n=1 Tax=Brassica oleracea var. oleracea TaxID=109376 RepID=UPI0006A701B4|nr:PREDICTED: zinc finger BED domain-containing protein RICESLEEPER 2-like [Brassica oleracea var. oleracea]